MSSLDSSEVFPVIGDGNLILYFILEYFNKLNKKKTRKLIGDSDVGDIVMLMT